MKWVKISLGAILGIIVLTAAGLAVAGMGKDANRIYSSTVIKAKPAAVWPWLYKPDKVKQWVTWLVEIREEREGEPTPGGKAVWVMEDRNNNNTRMSITGVVDSVDPYRRLAVSISAPEGFQGTNVYILTEKADGSTRLESDSRYTFDNAFARFMTPVVCWQAKKKMQGDLDHLRSLIEAQ
jgi:uncharacterized protein YndB with AHSA1/START domain